MWALSFRIVSMRPLSPRSPHLPIPAAQPVITQCREQKPPHIFQSERDLVWELGAYKIIKRLGGAEVPLRLFNSRTHHHRHHDPNVRKLLPPGQLIIPRHAGLKPWNNESGPCDCLWTLTPPWPCCQRRLQKELVSISGFQISHKCIYKTIMHLKT